MAIPALDPNRWRTLAVVGVAFFMTMLDVAIANVARAVQEVTVIDMMCSDEKFITG